MKHAAEMKAPARKSLGLLLMLAARLHRTRMAMLLDEIGLFPGQEQALQALAAQNGATMGDLARSLQVRPPTISKTIGRLTIQGLVERKTSVEDGRVVRVHLTPEGVMLLQRVDEITDAIEIELLDALDNKEAKRLRKLLRKVAKSMSHAVHPDRNAPLDLLQETENDFLLAEDE